MILDVSVVMTWILFLALFPMAFFWMRRAYRIFVKKNYSEVALKKGESPANPKKWAPIVGLLNLASGGLCIYVISLVLLGIAPYDEWSAYAGLTIWGKIIADFIIKMQAHPIQFGKKKDRKSNKTCAA